MNRFYSLDMVASAKNSLAPKRNYTSLPFT